MPYIFSALKISTSLAVVGAIISEFVGANEGIGFVILISSYHLEMVRMFSAVIAAALMGVMFYWAVSFVERRIVFWMTSDEH
jgi:NitT/TauT family transport system permease protein